jgi:hypothetical protein
MIKKYGPGFINTSNPREPWIQYAEDGSLRNLQMGTNTGEYPYPPGKAYTPDSREWDEVVSMLKKEKDNPGGPGTPPTYVWLDALLYDTVFDEASYRDSIDEMCEKYKPGKVGPCPPRDTPDQMKERCFNEGYPKFDGLTFLVAWSDLWKLADQPQFKWRSGGRYSKGMPVAYNGKEWVVIDPGKVKADEPPSEATGWVERPASFLTISNDNVPTIDPDFLFTAQYILEAMAFDVSKPRDQAKANEFIDMFGRTFVEYQNKREEFCNKVRDENRELLNYAEWKEKIGNKYNSPCPPRTTQSGAHLWSPDLDLDEPVCRQWRADATNLTNSLGPDAYDPKTGAMKALSYDKRIPPSVWTKNALGEPIDDEKKWIWQHENTTTREASGLNKKQPGGCDFPPLSADGIFRVSPDQCFASQKDYRDLMKAKKIIEDAKANEIDGLGGLFAKLLPSLFDFAFDGLADLVSTKDLKKFLYKMFSSTTSAITGTKDCINPNSKECEEKADAEKGNVKINDLIKLFKDPLKKAIFNTPETDYDNYLARFGDDKDYPGFYDPATEKKVPPQRPAERALYLTVERRTGDSGVLTKLKKTAKTQDVFGYDYGLANQSRDDSWRVRGGAKTNAKQTAIVDRMAEFLAERINMRRGMKATQGGARPHHKFEKILISYGISPDVYLNHARRKAKSAGLRASLLGFSHDEKHKLVIPNEEGRLVSFGSAGMGDHILYSLLKDPKANQHRTSYLARATKIRGDWKKSPYSPNSLAIKVLW